MIGFKEWTAFVSLSLTRRDFIATKWSILCSEQFTQEDYSIRSKYIKIEQEFKAEAHYLPSVRSKKPNDAGW